MWNYPDLVGHYILVLPGNIKYLLGITTRERIGYISGIFLSLSSVSNTVVHQYAIHNSKVYDDYGAAMGYVMSPSQDSVWRSSL